jgi:hypothetical protein
MSAFLVSAPSPFLPVASFGIFSGLLVGINYLFDLFCNIFGIKSTSVGRNQRLLTNGPAWFLFLWTASKTPVKHWLDGFVIHKYNNADKESRTETPTQKRNFEDRNKVVLFLKNGFYDFMTLRSVKIIIPLVFIGTSIFFIHSASTLEPDSNQVSMFCFSRILLKWQSNSVWLMFWYVFVCNTTTYIFILSLSNYSFRLHLWYPLHFLTLFFIFFTNIKIS